MSNAVAFNPCTICEKEMCSMCELQMHRSGLFQSNEWISVKEQLPKLNTMVLVFTMRGSFEVARYNIYHNGTLPLWMTNEDIWKNEIITHWIPLPPPPKMKGGAE